MRRCDGGGRVDGGFGCGHAVFSVSSADRPAVERLGDARDETPRSANLRPCERIQNLAEERSKAARAPDGAQRFSAGPSREGLKPFVAPQSATVAAGIRTFGREEFPHLLGAASQAARPSALDAGRSRSPLRGSSGFAPDSLAALQLRTQMLCRATATDTRYALRN